MSLRIAVIGVGYLGRHHARILSDLPGVELVAVVDTNRARAEEIAEAHKTRPLVDYREGVGQVDAETMGKPTALSRPGGKRVSHWVSGIRSGSIQPLPRRVRCWLIRASSRSTVWVRFRNEASISTSSST